MVRIPASCIWSHPAGVTQSTFSELDAPGRQFSISSWETTEIACVHQTFDPKSPALMFRLVDHGLSLGARERSSDSYCATIIAQ